ncbi:hypothetical protein Ancab_025198 [Ancistrocladus abbreviatus]
MMEGSSMNSRNYMSTLAPSSTAYSFNVHDNDQESGWTLYFKDFMADNSSENSSFLSGCEADSIASQKDIAYHGVTELPIRQSCERFSSKKRKEKINSIDDELEDTASSPVHSPKLNDLNQLYTKSKEIDSRSIYQGKANGSVQVVRDLAWSFREKMLTTRNLGKWVFAWFLFPCS